MQAKPEPKAYSYKRFSTPAQAEGDSLRRQTKMAQEWSDRTGVPLDTDFNLTDAGVSAYTGANRDVGNLGAFLRAVEDGTVPKGSWLLVESLDRLSREPVADALHAVQEIIRAGVTVVDLSDNGGQGRDYNLTTLRSTDGLMQLMAMLLTFARGNQESTLKGTRVAEKYAEKRRVFASGEKLTKPYTRRLPAWLRWNDDTASYELIEERVATLRWIFEMTDEGEGQHSIAAQLNAEGVDTWGAGKWKAKYWHRTYIRKLLTNKAAIGIFVPHRMVEVAGKRKKQRKALDAITNRFPAAIDRALFERVNSRLSTTEARGRNANNQARSVFAGIIKCQHCGGTVTRVAKGTYVYLVCAAANAKAGTCKYESVPYAEAEGAFAENIVHTVEQAPRGKDTADIEREIAHAQWEHDAASVNVDDLLNLAITDKSKAARDALREAEKEQARIADNLRNLRDRRDAVASAHVTARLNAVRKALTTDTVDVVEVNRALRTAVKKLVMKPRAGTADVYWHHAEEPQEVVFATSRKRWDENQVEGASEE